MTPPLVGKQIVLRDMKLSDIDTYRHWQMPGQQWQKLDGPYYPKPTAEQVHEQMERVTKRVTAGEWPPIRARLVVADKQTDALIGVVTRYWISEETHWSAIGIVLFDPVSWGKGIGYEALGLWSDYLFANNPAWVRLDLRTWSGNHGMMRLAEKLGYREEARFRNARIVDGAYFDGLGYGILREEWTARYPNRFAASLNSA